MTRVIEIESCRSCPNCDTRTVTCDQTGALLFDLDSIPEECPLDTIQSYCTSNYNPDED